MKTTRKLTAVLLALVILLGAMPGAVAMNFWCPDEGLKHDWGAAQMEDVACGWIVGYRFCKRCGAGEEVKVFIEHDWSPWKWCGDDVGTCVYEGSQERHCKRCGKGEDRSKYGDHKYGYWLIKEEQTCTEPGEQRRICELCKHVQERYVDPLGHDYGEWVLVKVPTPEEPGLMESVCSRCGDTLQKEVTVDELTPEMMESYNFVSELTVELVSEHSPVAKAVGEEVTVRLKTTNTGDTVVSLVGHGIYDADDFFRSADYHDAFETEDGVSVARFKPNDVMHCNFHLVVTEEDIARGEIFRDITIWSYVRRYPNGMPESPYYDYPGEESAKSDTSSFVSGTVRVVIPIIGVQEIGVEKLEVSEPANGEYYTEGEVVDYEISLLIPSGLTLEEVVIYDQLENQAEPTVVKEMASASAADGDSLVSTFSYTVTAEDVERGYIRNTAFAYFYDPEGDAYVNVYSEDVVVLTVPGEDPQAGIAVLEKKVVSTPANGFAYTLGEIAEYEIVFKNLVEHELHDVEIVDPLKGGNEDSVLTIEPVVAPMSEMTLSFRHTVTEEDVARGYIENTASAAWFNPEIEEFASIDSNTVTVSTINADFGMSDLVYVYKEITSTPANGMFFVPGEVVSFTISVTNTSDDALYDIDVIDLMDGTLAGQIDVLWSGETAYAVYEYTLTELDPALSPLVNCAYVYGKNPAGEEFTEFSNDVIVPCGYIDDPFGVINAVEIVKAEESTPLNGSYYELGEEIRYSITYTNTGELMINEVIVYDSLNPFGEIASAELFGPGDTRTCYYTYVVNEHDVVRGYVVNTAFADYTVNGVYSFVISNTVCSDTNGIADEPGAGDKYFGTVDVSKLAQGEDFCESRVIARNGNSVTAENHFCAAHLTAQEMVDTMLTFANDPEFRAQAYEYAENLWKGEAEKLYTELLKAADAEAYATIVNEFMAFTAYANNFKVLALAAYPEDAVAAQKAVSDLWRNKMIDLCCELNTMPEKRADSFFGAKTGENMGESSEVCTHTEDGHTENTVICPQHAFLFSLTDAFVGEENQAENWAKVRGLWVLELNKAVNKIAEGENALAAYVLAVEADAFSSWLAAREAVLTIEYPDNPEIVQEIVTQLVIDRVSMLCEMAK